MKSRWLLLLCALTVGVIPACDSKSKDSKASKDKDDDEDEDDKADKKKKKKKDDEKGASSGSAATTSKADTPPPPAPTEQPKPPLTKEQVAAFLKDESQKLSADAFESLLLGIADCRVDSFGVDYKCTGRKELSDGMKHKYEDFNMPGTVAIKHLRNPSAAVRYEAAVHASLRAFGYDAPAEAGTKYLEAAKAETDSVVLARFISGMYSGAKKNAEVREFIMKNVDHKENRVREECLRLMGEPETAKSMPGVFDKILEKTNSDPDDHVRSVACSALSATEDPKAIPVFQKIIEDSSTKDELRQGCFEGLVETWTGYPYPKSPNKDGYELTMKVLEGKTRSKEMPPWRGLSKLGYAKTEYKDYDKSGKDWYNTAKAFYDKARLVKAVQAVAADDKAAYMARSESLYILKRLGEQKMLGELAATIKKQSGYDAKGLSESAEKYSKEKPE